MNMKRNFIIATGLLFISQLGFSQTTKNDTAKEKQIDGVTITKNKKPEDVKKTVAKFISDNKYTFNVLLDLDDKVAQSFKIKGVPCEIIINKEGNIISRSEGYDGNLGALIAENL